MPAKVAHKMPSWKGKIKEKAKEEKEKKTNRAFLLIWETKHIGLKLYEVDAVNLWTIFWT